MEGSGKVGTEPAATEPATPAWSAPGWIATLRAEGRGGNVIERLLVPLLQAGLAPWKGLDGQACDPLGPGRTLCADLEAEPAEVLDEIARLVRTEARYRLPPLARLLALGEAARETVARRQAWQSRLAALPAVPVLAAETARFLDCLAGVASPAQIAAWFAPAGIVRLRPDAGLADLVTPHRPVTVAQHAGSLADAAVRAAFGAGYSAEFVLGRAEPGEPAPAAAEADAAPIEVGPGDPRWEAWLTHWLASPGEVAGTLPGEVRRQRRAITVFADWPPPSAEVLEAGGRATIPWGTPEHAAWLCHRRRTGRAAQAQSADVGRRPLGEATRWPPIAATGGGP